MPVVWLLMAGAAALGAAYQTSPVRRLKRALRRGLRGLTAARRSLQAATAPTRARLRAAARAHAEQRWTAERARTPIEALRDVGAKGIALERLKAAGVRTLADVSASTAARLDAIEGVGAVTAARLREAAAQLERRIQEQAVALPAADPQDPVEQELALRAVEAWEAREHLGRLPHELAEHVRALEGPLEALKGRRAFLPWLLKGNAAHFALPELFKAQTAIRRWEAAEPDELMREARERAERAAALRPAARFGPESAARFREVYADAAALIETALLESTAQPGQVLTPGHPFARHLPADIVQAVESFPLRTDGLDVTLRRYQVFGAKYMLTQQRTILGDEMGLGKTIQALAAMTHRRLADDARHFVVVAPASITRNWVRETEKRSRLPVHLLHGADREQVVDTWMAQGGLAVVSYSTLRTLDLDESLAHHGVKLGFLVADEAHYAKNPDAGRSLALRRLLSHAERACLLSGTPMENHPGEFCELVGTLREDIAATLREGDAIAGETVVSPRAFHRAVAPVYLRRNQEDVLKELPPRVVYEEWVDLDAVAQDAYREAVEARNLMGMRRVVTLAQDQRTSAKLDRLAEILAEHRESGRKVLVFSFFLDVVQEVARRFGALGMITGSVSGEKRMELVDAFSTASGHSLLSCQILAAGVGLNLQAASVIVLMEPQFKPTVEEQAIARAHRMGQTQTVLVHRMLARESVDERLMELLAGKLDLFQTYARESLIKKASREATEASLGHLVIEAEAQRLRTLAPPEAAAAPRP